MKLLFTVLLLQPCVALFSQNSILTVNTASPLASYSKEWNDVKYSACNTAATTAYMSNAEKNIIYVLNLIRTNPALFAKTVLKQYPSVSGNDYLADDTFYYKSLMNTLLKMGPCQVLYPDNACFTSAKCHAYNSGITGYVGHERKTKACKTKTHFYGECCDYGHDNPLDVVLSLLIDEGIPSLGHRAVCLGNYSMIGVSIQPHIKYGHNAVLDFYY
jgi:uncharacterized protein YkwD